MNIKPADKTIKALLKSGRQFMIPRFQRDYSWEKKNCEEFLDDIIKCLKCKDGKLETTSYFLGTMLFIGNFDEKSDKEIQVVDGQQRITTITILFSAISDIFREKGEDNLSKLIFSYIMTSDDDGNEVRIIKSESSYPFFSYYIQDREKIVMQEPSSEEELCIQSTYRLFCTRLEEKNLKDFMSENCDGFQNDISLIDILKAIRDQILNCIFISISTDDNTQAYRIFEILNAKGKKLAAIDLIKNRLFEKLRKTEPADYAKCKWDELKRIINECDLASVGIGTYYRHFWNSCYRQTGASQLYDRFLSIVKTSDYESFLDSLVQNAKYYVQIIKPTRDDYQNRKEYYWLVQSFNVLSNYFGIAQVRVVLMALLWVKDNNLISTKDFKQVILFLESFHFAYTAVMSGKANRLDGIYSKFSIAIRKSSSKNQTKEIIQSKLYACLTPLIPTEEQFTEQFTSLCFTKKATAANMKCKYALQKLNCYYQQKEIFEDDSSIEHILPECNKGNVTNIGNLIMLEGNLNTEADNIDYAEKLKVYEKSNYKWVHEFTDKHPVWEEEMIRDRAKSMAALYYHAILNF